MIFNKIPKALQGLLDDWKANWPDALAAWSRFTKLSEPRWCFDKKGEKAEGLTDSFAMIRLDDHAVVISLRMIHEQGLDKFAAEILAHEIGHHVYAPADLRDNARLLARIRAGLPSVESWAGLVSNLYTDLLINDRLQRDSGLDMAGVYKKLKAVGGGDRLWAFYMRTYEILWSLPPETLTPKYNDEQIQGDAGLGARVIRAYAKDWLNGAGRFAALVLPYLIEAKKKSKTVFVPVWMDAMDAGVGDELPDGLAGIEEGEIEGAVHPAEDPEITGLLEDEDGKKAKKSGSAAGGREKIGGQKNQYRDPVEYKELMKALGVKLPENEIVMRYYRERAIPHLIKFPTRIVKEATDPLPESLDVWEPGFPLQEVDWIETMIRSPEVIPGVTTVKRLYGTTEGGAPERRPVDLYLGVDCSGSMGNPAYSMSFPILAGTVVVLSALRAGARVMVCLSGEPGGFSETDGFIRDEKTILKTLTGYLGTGYAFGVKRLKEAFLDKEPPNRPAHILIVSDSDWFDMLRDVKGGWDMARKALEKAGGGGTCVLQMWQGGRYDDLSQRLIDDGWNVHYVSDWKEMVAFARAFAKAKYEDLTAGSAGKKK